MNSGTARETRPVRSDRQRLLERFDAVRERTEQLCSPLEPEDCVVQSMPDASPTRWHLAHTTWFFETFVLERVPQASYTPASIPSLPRQLFNSYYQGVGSAIHSQPPIEHSCPARHLRKSFAYRRARSIENCESSCGRLLDRGTVEELAGIVEHRTAS